MMKKLMFIMIAVFSVNLMSAQTEVGGAEIPNSLNFEGKTMVLNGAGVREKMWIDLYAGGLYLTEKSSNAASIVSSNAPMAIKLHIVSKLISSEKMVDAVNEGFENSTGGNMKNIQPQIEQFRGLFSEEIKKNDVFDLVYLPEKGVNVYKNGKIKGSIEGMEFKKALFGIWLSNRPADDDLKNAMLGK